MTDKIKPEAMEAFLKEMTELAVKHRIVVGGCGCCSSPWVEPMRTEEEGGKYAITKYDEQLEWVKP